MLAKGQHNQTWIGRVVISVLVLGMTLLMTGCNAVDGLAVYLKQTSAAQAATIEVYSSDSPDGFFKMAYFAGRYTALIDRAELKELITDNNSLLTYTLGLYLAWNPDLTYEEFQKKLAISGNRYDGTPVQDVVSELEFNHYRILGGLWLDSMLKDPKNQILLARMELFDKRMGTGDYSAVENLRIDNYVDLLNDDEELAKFLTDDDYADDWLRANISGEVLATKSNSRTFLKELIFNLGPVYTGVTPGTGS